MPQAVGAFSNGWAIDTAAPIDLNRDDKADNEVSWPPAELFVVVMTIIR